MHMRFAFQLSENMKRAIRDRINSALGRIDLERYSQEPAYVTALISRLDGVVYDGPDGRVEIKGTIVEDRGAHSAESLWGADFAITAALTVGQHSVEKGILGQAKKKSMHELNLLQDYELRGQCSKMLAATDHCIVLGLPKTKSLALLVRLVGEPLDVPMEFQEYILERFLPCYHGDMRMSFVRAIQDSKLKRLHFKIMSRE